MKHPIAEMPNGTLIYVDLVHSPAALHIAAQPRLVGLVKEALKNSSLKTPMVYLEKDMGRDIGYDFVVEAAVSDSIFYAQLLRKNQYTRFVKNKKALPTSYLTIILQRDDEGSYALHDTWIGRLSPPLPGATDETPGSKLYWDNHALIFDKQPLQSRTITRVCPY
ncbi:MAG TPA: hypothetical protein VNX65_02230 [Patescibacteria group bacterium]|jgi:hypothetical protein|nr:hypothetical protein [Patescibacteria group bacterium]